MTREEMIKASQNQDKSYTGKFFLAVKSTKIVCNPGCSSKVPLKKNMTERQDVPADSNQFLGV